MKILYTGFEPFGGEKTNPSYEALALLPDSILGAQVLHLQVPAIFTEGWGAILSAIREQRPDIVICCGQAGKRCCVTPEYVAINYRHARIPDNAGVQPRDERISPEGPAAYFSLLPVHGIASRCRQEGIPCEVSYTAGTYVCNEVMYRLLQAIEKEFPSLMGGFIHVPFSTDQMAAQDSPFPSLPLPLIARALGLAGEESVKAYTGRA